MCAGGMYKFEKCIDAVMECLINLPFLELYGISWYGLDCPDDKRQHNTVCEFSYIWFIFDIDLGILQTFKITL